MISLPPRCDSRIDDRRELIAVIVGVVQPIAVGGFDEQDVGVVDRHGIGQHRAAVTSEVAAKQDRLAAERDARVGRAEQVAGVDELDLEARHDRHRTVVADRLQQRERPFRVGRRVERQRGLCFE